MWDINVVKGEEHDVGDEKWDDMKVCCVLLRRMYILLIQRSCLLFSPFLPGSCSITIKTRTTTLIDILLAMTTTLF